MLLTTVIRFHTVLEAKSQRGDDDYDGIQILSISSCKVPKGDYAKKKRRSFIEWTSTLFDSYGDGQSKLNDIFVNQIKPYLDFDIEITRVENEPISSKQSKEISLDKAGKDSLNILKGIGSYVGNNAKNKPEVIKFYTENKTTNP